MNVKLYEGQKHTIYQITKHCGFSLNYLYMKIVGNRIDKIPYIDLKKIADYEEVDVNYLYEK